MDPQPHKTIDALLLASHIKLLQESYDSLPEGCCAEDTPTEDWAGVTEWAHTARQSARGLILQLEDCDMDAHEDLVSAVMSVHAAITSLEDKLPESASDRDVLTARMTLRRCIEAGNKLILPGRR
ncbi:hypothetical protein [Hoeflea sp. TYP-13]|uniref:hypothetical protein n=1 Tax=Hoeflea sp. TYP-13 TaxID=3230023 RepID=UPI0034C5F887